MKTKIAAVFTALAVLFTGVAVAAPASAAPSAVVAGNGTSNYYLKGSCSDYRIGGIAMSATNWDYGPNQYYHLNVTRTGPGFSITGVYKDGVYLGKSLGEYQPWDGGHGQSYLYVTANLVGLNTKYACGFWL